MEPEVRSESPVGSALGSGKVVGASGTGDGGDHVI
jgi:hypothetical protein